MRLDDDTQAGRPVRAAATLPAYQQLADHLREQILSGRLRPGDRLPSEVELGANFGVSRSTVREALRLLASRDLLTTTRGATGGTFVAQVRGSRYSDQLEMSIGLLSGDELGIGQILEARELLEVPAAGLAAERRDEGDLSAMEQALLRKEEDAVENAGFRDHREFHALVVHAAGNALLELMTAPVFRVLQGRFLRQTLPQEWRTAVEHDHRDIFDAIASSDARGAERAMVRHLRRLRVAYETVTTATDASPSERRAVGVGDRPSRESETPS